MIDHSLSIFRSFKRIVANRRVFSEKSFFEKKFFSKLMILVDMLIVVILFAMMKKMHEIYVDCQAR